MQVSIAIAAYFGNRDLIHDKCYIDKLYYIKTQLHYIDLSNTQISKIYIVCTFENDYYKNSTIEELMKLAESDDRICIICRDNLGGSYCSWHRALEFDSGFSDYIIFIEDDYTLCSKNSVNYMLEYFMKNNNLFYLCQYWVNNPYKLIYGDVKETIPSHAAMSCGMIDNKMYFEALKNQLDFRLVYNTGKPAMFANQVLFLENYRNNGYKIMDYAKEHSSIFAQDAIEYGNPAGEKIMLPIIEQFFN